MRGIRQVARTSTATDVIVRSKSLAVVTPDSSFAYVRRLKAQARVGFVTTSYPQKEDDPAGHFVHAEVVAAQRAGFRTHVLAPPHGGAFGWPGAAARLRAQPWRATEVAAWIGQTRAALRELDADYIVCHWCVPSAWPTVTSGPVARVPVEVVSHGGDVRLLTRMPHGMRRWMVNQLLARAEAWRFVSTALVEQLASAVEPAQQRRLHAIAYVAPSPIAHLDVRGEVQANRASLGGRPLYVCAGRLVKTKRVDRVIDYVADRRNAQPILVIIGDGPERRRLEAQAQRWQIETRFLGTRPRREALGWIGAADEFVHASQAEGCSTVVREAKQLGVSVTQL